MTGFIRLRHLLRERDVREAVDEQVLSVYRDLGVVTRAGRVDNFNKTPLDVSNYKLVLPGDVVVNKMKAWTGSVGVSDHRGIVSGDYLVCSTTGVNSRYLHHLMRSQPLVAEYGRRSSGIRPQQWRLYWDDLAEIRVHLPPIETQRAVADHLDAETARIDALITKRQRQIDLLEQQLEARIVGLVLGGPEQVLRAPAEGEYLGWVDDWARTTLRHLRCDVQTGPFGSQLHSDEYVTGGWPVVNPMNMRAGKIVADFDMTVDDRLRQTLRRHILAVGDIVFGRRGEMGRAGLVTEEESGWVCGTGSLRLRVRDDRLLSPYLKLLLEMPPLRDYFAYESVGSTMQNLNSDIVLGMPMLLPPPGEQARIVHDVESARSRSAVVKAALERQIELLRERRQALITAAVTGELAVT